MQRAYINAIYSLAEKDDRVLLLTADNGTDFDRWYKQDFEDRYFDFGISECNMVGAAAGMASCGMIPFVQTGGSFLAYRALEFIRNDVCLQKQNVKIIGTGSGLSISNLGPTHHTTEDISILRSLPELTILSPASAIEVEKCINAAYEINGPVYLRLGMDSQIKSDVCPDTWAVDKMDVIIEGNRAVIFSTGSILTEIMEEREWYERHAIKVVNVHTLKPLASDELLKHIGNCKTIFSLEEHSVFGGLGSIISEIISENAIDVKLRRIGLTDTFAKGYGNNKDIRKSNGIDSENIRNIILSEM